jgi:hypothetical protein
LQAVLFPGSLSHRFKPPRSFCLIAAQTRVELLRPQRVIFLERLMDPRTRG